MAIVFYFFILENMQCTMKLSMNQEQKMDIVLYRVKKMAIEGQMKFAQFYSRTYPL